MLLKLVVRELKWSKSERNRQIKALSDHGDTMPYQKDGEGAGKAWTTSTNVDTKVSRQTCRLNFENRVR